MDKLKELKEQMELLQDQYDEANRKIAKLTQRSMEISSYMAEIGQAIIKLEKEQKNV